jgi:hypothetical protein
MQQHQQHERGTKAKPQQCQDAEGCSAEALFRYTWPDTQTEYVGCTRHAYKAAAVVGQMGRTLELVPIDGGAAVTIGNALGTPAPAAAPAPSSAELAELAERVTALEQNAKEGRELEIDRDKRVKALESTGLGDRVNDLHARLSKLEKK